MDPWPSFYFTMVATVIFSLVFIGADSPDPLLLFAQLWSFSGQVRKLSLGKVPNLLSGRMACCGTWKADLRMSQKCQHVHCVSLCWTSSILCNQDLSYQREGMPEMCFSVLCGGPQRLMMQMYLFVYRPEQQFRLNAFLVMVYYTFLGCRALGTPWLFPSVFLLWLGIVTFWMLF